MSWIDSSSQLKEIKAPCIKKSYLCNLLPIKTYFLKTILGGIVRSLTALLILTTCSLAFANSTANVRSGVMLYGYDPVSYFKAAAPTKGDPKIQSIDSGLTYYFSNEENKVEFEKNKSKYLPAYEGWCATAVAGGYKYDIDPLNYKITNGRLFLFYKGWLGDAKKDWLKNENEQITKADKQWPTVRTTKE